MLSGGSRGRIIPYKERAQAVNLINEACTAGALKRNACNLLGVSVRTIERWEKENGLTDKRKQAIRLPANKLTKEERERILMIANSKNIKICRRVKSFLCWQIKVFCGL